MHITNLVTIHVLMFCGGITISKLLLHALRPNPLPCKSLIAAEVWCHGHVKELLLSVLRHNSTVMRFPVCHWVHAPGTARRQTTACP